MKIKQFVTQFFSERYFCGLDIGSQKIKACLAHVKDSETLELLAVYEIDTRGFKDTTVNDVSEFSACIGTALEALVKKTQIRFQDVYLGISGDLIDTRKSRAVIPLTDRGTKVITPHDVQEARRQARLLGARLDEEVMHDFVIEFKVDDVNIALNPIGLYGRKLEVESMLVVSNITSVRNISKAIKQAGFEVNSVFFSGHALADTLLDHRHKLEGTALIDIGANHIQSLVFKEGLLKHYAHANHGGEKMTRRIAEALSIHRDLAEDIKRSYARVQEKKAGVEPSEAAAAEEILIKKEEAFVPVKRMLLNDAIETEVVKTIEFIRKSVEAPGYKGQLKSVVMVGGGSLLPGLMERVEASLEIPVSLGKTIAGLNNAVSYCASTSLAELAYKGSARYVFDTRKPKDWMDAVRQRSEELFNEYF